MDEPEFPLSAGKMAAALAISLVDRAYCLGAVKDGLRQSLLEKLRIFQADLDRVEGRLIQGSLPSNLFLFREVTTGFWRFREAVEETESAIDEISYRRLEQEEVGNPISKFVKRNITNKVTKFYSSASNGERLRYAIAILYDQLPLLCADLRELADHANDPSPGYESYGYPSWLATAEGISGRERDKEDLVQSLINDDTNERNPFSICAVVGGIGAGKTMLTNTVREDPIVLAYFDFVVPLPKYLGLQSLMTSILETTGNPSSYSDMRFLGNSFIDMDNLLAERLRDKRLLLIPDTLVEPHQCWWEILRAPQSLKVCKRGSKILLTTEDSSIVHTIARDIDVEADLLFLERQLPSQVGSKDYPESTPPIFPYPYPKHNRYPSWISNGGIFGRDREREQIVQWLVMDTAEHNPLFVYALVGMAGMGKTTLANVVSRDPRVSGNFQAVVWVPVSIVFDTESMTRVILESIIGRSPAYFSWNLLRNSLTETLRYRKVLLILDDVWEDNSVDKWETLVSPFRVCKKGSRILLTTRMQSVVDMAAIAVGSQAKYLKMVELNENDNLNLFKSRLPFQADSKGYENLLMIGEQIVKKIGGCPLVTSLIASWLGRHMDTHHWITILQKGWQHLEEMYIVHSSLRSSYDCLPTELQTCFRYCSLFPKGYKFNKLELAKMWAGSGVISFSTSKVESIGLRKTKYVDFLSAEDVGENHFDELVRKSFFCCMLETETSDGNQQEFYILHDLMHDLAEHVSKDECARVDSCDWRSISITTRHLAIDHGSNLGATCRNLVDIFREQSSFGIYNLRTLIIHSEFRLDQETEFVLAELLKQSRSLRLLYLGVPSLFCALNSVPNLIHLRYLFLFSCDKFHLQKVFKLYHLQVFKLEYLGANDANCIDIHSLRCLHSLHVPDNMSSVIQNIGKLTLLQQLNGFGVVENDGRRLSALGNLRSLCQLTLRNLQHVSKFKEAVDIKLKEKHGLKHLSLSWNKHLKEPVDQDGIIIDTLEPNKEIQLLHIHGYSGAKLPVWIENSSLNNLVSLELEYCMKWKSLPSLKELTLLKHLKLENLFHLEYIGIVLEQQFETNELENACLPPFLSTLTVQWCPKLTELPDLPCTLELLIIKHAHLVVLPAILQIYTGEGGSAPAKSQLGLLHIESCGQLTSMNTGLLEQQEQLHSLKTIVLRHCERLHCLPTRGFAELCHLNSLEIVACPILRDIVTEDHLLPVSLENLHVNPCGDINVSILMSLQHLTALRRLNLFNCSNTEELPSVQVFGTVKNLNDVSIARCRSLLSMGGLGAVASLRVLSILCCDKISSSYCTKDICTFKLQKLTIDREALLSVEPLRSLSHTSELHIIDDCTMESLPGEWLLQNWESLHSIEIRAADSLHSLPCEIEKLKFLQSLHIERAPLLQSLPQLSASLRKLTIWGCDPVFLKCYERDVGSDWSKIAHIASVNIQAYSEGIDYCDDESQYLVTSTSHSYRKYIVID